MVEQRGFLFIPERCIKCHACEVACKLQNEIEIGPRWRRVIKIDRYELADGEDYIDTKLLNISMACMHCGTPPCAFACPVRAISKRSSDGIVTVDRKKCVGCLFCNWACPFGAPQLGNDGKMEKCEFCQDREVGMKRACEEICPTEAIITGTTKELTKIAKERAAKGLIKKTAPSLFMY